MSDAFGEWEWDRLAGGNSSVVARGAGANLYEPFAVQARSTFLRFIIPEFAPGSVLEVGCGKGQWLELLKSHGFAATGGDGSEQMVAQARAVEPSVVQFDAADLPFADRSFDNALTVTVLQHISDPRPAIAELARVSRQRIVLHEMTSSVVPGRLSPGTTARSVSWYEDAFAAHGWRPVRNLSRGTPRPSAAALLRAMPRGAAALSWLPRAAGLFAAAHTWLVFER